MTTSSPPICLRKVSGHHALIVMLVILLAASSIIGIAGALPSAAPGPIDGGQTHRSGSMTASPQGPATLSLVPSKSEISGFSAAGPTGGYADAPVMEGANPVESRTQSIDTQLASRIPDGVPPGTTLQPSNVSGGGGIASIPGRTQQEPAPMGVTDFGDNILTGKYSYSTSRFTGSVNITNLTANGPYGNVSSFQLNVELLINGQIEDPLGRMVTYPYAYWIQDVVSVSPIRGGANLTFVNNIWNHTKFVYYYDENAKAWFNGSYLDNRSVSGRGSIQKATSWSGVEGGYYYEEAAPQNPGCGLTVRNIYFPNRIDLSVQTGTTANGTVYVLFFYKDGPNNQVWCQYDNVSFPFATVNRPSWNTNGFEVDGSQGTPDGIHLYDAEMVWGGAGGGQNVSATNANLCFALNYSSPSGSIAVPSAWDYGSNTAEGVSNVTVTSPGPYANTSRTYWVHMTTGGGQSQLHFLYTSTLGTNLTLSQTSGVVGGNHTASGTGYSSNKGVSFWIWYAGIGFKYATPMTHGTCPTNGLGTFSGCWFSVPPDNESSYWIIASDGMHTGVALFSVTPSLVLSETSGKARAGLAVFGTGLPYRQTLYLSFCQYLYFSCTASWTHLNETWMSNVNGSYTWRNQIPVNATIGTSYLVVNDSTAGQVAYAPYTVPGPALTISYLNFYSSNATFALGASGLGFHPSSPMSFSAVTSYNASPTVRASPSCQASSYGNFTNCAVYVTARGYPQGYSPLVSITVTAHDDQAKWLTSWLNVTVGNNPTGIAVNPVSGNFYVTNYNDATVSIVSNATYAVLATLPVGRCPSGIAYDGARSKMYVADACAATLTVINATLNSVVGTVQVGQGPVAVAYDPAQNEIMVANSGANTMSVVNDRLDESIATVSVGTDPTGIAYDAGHGLVYVANTAGNSVTVVAASSNSVIRTVTVGHSPSALAYDSGRGEIAVSNSGDGTLGIINDTSQSVIAVVTVGPADNGVAYDAVDHMLLVTSRSNNAVYVVNDTTNQVYATVGTGTSPIGVIYSSGTIAVANSGSSSVSITKWTYAATATLWIYIP